MKRLVTLGMLACIIMFGCAQGLELSGIGLDIENTDMAVFTVESLAVPIGYYAAKNELLDTGLREIYSLAVEGKLTPEGVNRILAALNPEDPLQVIMIKRALRLAELAGATVQLGQITDITGLDQAYVEAIARGYAEGYDTYFLTKES